MASKGGEMSGQRRVRDGCAGGWAAIEREHKRRFCRLAVGLDGAEDDSGSASHSSVVAVTCGARFIGVDSGRGSLSTGSGRYGGARVGTDTSEEHRIPK